MRFLKDESHSLILVSGRNITMAKKIQKQLNNNRISMIGCNGACIYHNDELIEENELSKDEIRFLYDYTRKRKNVNIWLFFTNIMPLIITVNDLSKPFEVIGKLGMKMQFAYYEDFVFGDNELEKYLNNPECKFYKFMPCYGFGKKGIESARADLDNCIKDLSDKFEVIWSNNAIEIMKKNVNKANALKKLLNVLELKESETAVVGDSGNDIPLFEAFDNSFCMSHTQSIIKKKANNIVKGVYEIEDYL